jgi:alkylation response protein AidB-like acyl-CoA dehydrogenase
MDFAFTPEQVALRDTARDYLGDRFPLDRIERWAAPTADQPADPSDLAVWKEIAGLGWLDDLDVVDLVVLAEEGGRALCPLPWLTTVALALPAYRAAGLEPPGPAALAWAEPAPGRWRLADAAVPVDGAGPIDEDSPADLAGSGSCLVAGDGAGKVRLSGYKSMVFDGARATELVVAAGTALYLVDPADVVVTPVRSTIDPTRPPAELRLADTPARVLVEPAADLLRGIRWRALALFAAEAVGVAGRALEMATEHARVRTQFGRPIGANQAVAHRLADVYAELELARSLAYRAAWWVADGDPDGVPEAVVTATLAGRRAALHACEAAIQTLGAIGFTWEHPVHRWYRRARWLAGFDGFAPTFRAELAALLLGG